MYIEVLKNIQNRYLKSSNFKINFYTQTFTGYKDLNKIIQNNYIKY